MSTNEESVLPPDVAQEAMIVHALDGDHPDRVAGKSTECKTLLQHLLAADLNIKEHQPELHQRLDALRQVVANLEVGQHLGESQIAEFDSIRSALVGDIFEVLMQKMGHLSMDPDEKLFVIPENDEVGTYHRKPKTSQ